MNTKNATIARTLRTTLTPALIGAAAMLVSASGASAQRVIDLDAPAPPRAPSAPAAPARIQGDFHATYSVTNDKDRVNVESDGKSAEVRLNGAVITTLSLTDDWTRYEVQNAKGDVVATILRPNKLSPMLSIYSGEAPEGASALLERFPGTASWTLSTEPAEPSPFRMLARAGGASAWANHPKVMIGVYLGTMGEDEAAQAGLDPDNVTEISGVADEGPAAKAGLRAGDIITSIDGSTNADLSSIQDVLSGKSPGDTLALTILRDGRPQSVNLTLDAYDATIFGQGAFVNWAPLPPLTPDQIADRQAKMQALTAQLSEMTAQLGQVTGAEANEIRQHISELTSQLSALSMSIAQNTFFGLGEPGRVWVDIQREEGGQGGKKVILMPEAAGGGQNEALQLQFNDLQARIDEQLAEMDRRMEEMDQRIDRKLDELVNRLIEKMNEKAANPR